MVSNFLGNKEDLYSLYGVTLSGAPGTIQGLYIGGGISLSTGASTSTAPLVETANEAKKAVSDAVASKIGSLLGKKSKVAGAFLKETLGGITNELSKSLSNSIQLYEKGSGFNLNLEILYIPGLWNSGDYSELEDFATKATLPKNIAGVAGPYSQYLYNPAKARSSMSPDLSTDLISLDLMNGKITVPGGLYITNISRNYSEDLDENKKPVYCKVSVSLEYYRDLFANEYKSFINI